jgi:hypothetical protein
MEFTVRVTVIPSDSIVYMDGIARHVVLPPHDPNWRAIQWYSDRGDIEVYVGAGLSIDDQSIIAPFITAWEEAAPPPLPALTSKPSQPAAGVEEM